MTVLLLLLFRYDIIKIPTAKPMFSGSMNRMTLVPILPDVTGSQNFKMATAKSEVPISQLLDKMERNSNDYIDGFDDRNSMALPRILTDKTGCWNFKTIS